MYQFLLRVIRITRNILHLNPPSTLEKKKIKKLIKRRNPVIFEIGCADGLDTLEFLKIFPDPGLRIYCFEPDPRNIEAFQKNVRDPRVQLFSIAIGDKNGEAVFHQSSTIYSSSLKEPNITTIQNTWPMINFDNQFKVMERTLDSFIAEHNIDQVDFVWVDVQGAEDLLIRGAQESLKNKILFFYTEYNNVEYYKDEPNLLRIIQGIGSNWKVVRDYKTDVLLKNINFIKKRS